MPEPDFFVTTAKTLLECASVKPSLTEVCSALKNFHSCLLLKLFWFIVFVSLNGLKAAIDVLSDLMQEDDDNVELW